MPKKLLDKTFWKFLLVGCINTVFGTTIMFVFYNCLHLSYWLSSASNYFFGSILSYFLNKYFTFKYKERSLRVIGRFVINICVCYVVAYGIAKPLTLQLLSGVSVTVRENVAMLVGTVLFTLLNYFGQRFFAFRGKK
ncbi:MAG: GtrA family protein [Oscillospiraceae bacterium]|nr:GtrA family protein [Oscillospiraceae bacterium]